MDIRKEANGIGEVQVDAADLALINKQSRKKLTAEEVYTFAVRLCDNEIDREWERFGYGTLEELAKLFVGKSGLFDHNWTATGQNARIYRAEVVKEDGQVTRAGDQAYYLKAYAYMLRNDANRNLIEEIEGGIKREVSVGCSVEREVCSVCGEAMGTCRHQKGRTYDGRLCWGELEKAKDAYEWSFVAVPAQPKAGVIKGYCPDLKTLAGERESTRAELERLEREAQLGRKYLTELRSQVVKLAAVGVPTLEMRVVKSVADKLEEDELQALKELFLCRREEKGSAQFSYGAPQRERDTADGAFLV